MRGLLLQEKSGWKNLCLWDQEHRVCLRLRRSRVIDLQELTLRGEGPLRQRLMGKG
jgi:hypothetical protein